MFENKEIQDKFILVAVQLNEKENTESYLDELEELVYTAGGEVAGRMIQARESIHPGTYIGKGKIEELKDLVFETGATAVVCDDELSPAQYKNLEDELDVKVMDRTLIILDIFAGRARTAEGKIQVELAQLRYRSTRLIGMRNLSRLGGGIGTRGPGEKKLEVDRRLIRERISNLKAQVKELASHRELLRDSRSEKSIPVVAIVGYTNAGKSTLLNALTSAGVLQEDKLFATLDPTTRKYKLSTGEEVLLTDTVGFIRKLPHHLIEAFKSTLEEAKFADIIIHMADASNPALHEHIHTVYETLEKLEVKDKTIITVFNKMDKLEERPILRDFKSDYTVYMSLKTKEGIEDFDNCLSEAVKSMRAFIKKTIPYEKTGEVGKIRKYGQLIKEEYTDEGICIEAYVPKHMV